MHALHSKTDINSKQ